MNPQTEYYISRKIQIFPTDKQKLLLDRYIDLYRCVYNWAINEIEQWEIAYNVELENKRRPSIFDLERKFTKFKHQNSFLDDMPYGSAKLAVWAALNNYKMYDKFIIGFKKPKFKSKKKQNKSNASYRTRCNRMYFSGSKLRIEGLPKGEMIETKYNLGYITPKDNPEFFKSTIVRDNIGRYWITYTIIQKKITVPCDNEKISSGAIGIDINKTKRFVLSTGKIYYAPDISKAIKQLKHAQRHCQKDINRRKQLEKTNPNIDSDLLISNRAKKRSIVRNKKRKKISNIVRSFNHKVTKEIILMQPKAIVMEDIKVHNIIKNKYTKRHMFGVVFSEIIEMMKYKSNIYNIPFVQAPDDYPSTQLCSRCGRKKKMYSQKKYICDYCGLIIDRDINAAKNLEKLAYV